LTATSAHGRNSALPQPVVSKAVDLRDVATLKSQGVSETYRE
jgi:hypothetical protein